MPKIEFNHILLAGLSFTGTTPTIFLSAELPVIIQGVHGNYHTGCLFYIVDTCNYDDVSARLQTSLDTTQR